MPVFKEFILLLKRKTKYGDINFPNLELQNYTLPIIIFFLTFEPDHVKQTQN